VLQYLRPSAGRLWAYYVAAVIYIFSVWEHIPYGGGHIYSDIVTVFQTRFCSTGPCIIALPYVHVFVEYPFIVGMFIYVMALLGQSAPILPSQGLLINYYIYSAIFLAFPTFLSIRELFKLGELLGLKSSRRRILLYFIITPTFVFMVLLNWYIIGVFFALFGLRKFLTGSTWVAGALLGLSAAANLITAVPALGLLLSSKDARAGGKFVCGALISFGLVCMPFLVASPSYFSQFVTYEANWYVEGSWMLLFIPIFDPLRHILFPVSFVVLGGLIVYKGLRVRRRARVEEDWRSLAVMMAALFSFDWLFSSYVATPQTNAMLLPFFVLAPIAFYPEFLAFDLATSLIDVWGFSQPLLILGITLHPVPFGSPFQSPIQALEAIKSLWIGKFLIYDGLLRSKFLPRGSLGPKVAQAEGMVRKQPTA
jgi:hypothetical protein